MANTYPPDKRRLQEAIWRIQGNAGMSGIALFRRRVIDQELQLLANALGVSTLDTEHACPLCGKVHSEVAGNEVKVTELEAG